eukprot:6269227-Alexandrium_andersonii.AAC.1
MRAEVVQSDIRVSCTQGAGSLIDYVVASRDFVHLVSVEQDTHAPWKAHIGLSIRIALEAKSTRCQ